jgi:hypothetical protein
MKTCRQCNKEQPTTEFYKQARNKDGLFHECKECCKKQRNKRYKENPQAMKKQWKQWYQKRKQYYITKGHLRAKGVRQAKPKWLTDDHKWMIEEIYELRDLRSKLTGVVHHVDHIVPLRGQNCCGLHVPWNLQVIPAVDNLSKSNSIEGY